MCGIAGIIAGRGRQADPAAAAAMGRALAHRGPDGEGFWRSAEGEVIFAHRRLAIIDLDAAAAQPMANEDGRVQVVYNGEIYNHRALRAELQAAGHRFATRSADTEVLVHGYEEWGIEGLLSRLDGIFSFALHDGGRRRTLLVRDPVGIKPLYVAWSDHSLLFASEIRGLLACPGFPGRPALAHLADYLTFMAVPAPRTLVENVFKIPAGHFLDVATPEDCVLRRYWRATQAPGGESGDRAETVARLREHVARAVEGQMIADVPVGVLLSGGIDSSAILSQATRARGAGVDAYSVGFTDDASLDETAAAAGVAKRFGARHHVFRLTPEQALAGIDAMVDALDEPLADWVCLPLFALAREVAADGCKVVLVGEGADEQFAGYEHWRAYLGPVAKRFAQARLAAPLARAAARLAPLVAPADMRTLTRADFLRRAATGGELFWGGAILCWPLARRALLRGTDFPPAPAPRWRTVSCVAGDQADADGRVKKWFADIDRDLPGADPLTRMIAVEFLHRLPELLLMRVDKMTMAHGVEARVPLLDRKLIEFSMAIPGAMKTDGQTKSLLRDAVAGWIPEEIRLAPKKGFGAPVDRWLRGPFAAEARTAILDGPLGRYLISESVARLFAEHAAGRRNHAGLIWALFVAARWLQRGLRSAA